MKAVLEVRRFEGPDFAMLATTLCPSRWSVSPKIGAFFHLPGGKRWTPVGGRPDVFYKTDRCMLVIRPELKSWNFEEDIPTCRCHKLKRKYGIRVPIHHFKVICVIFFGGVEKHCHDWGHESHDVLYLTPLNVLFPIVISYILGGAGWSK